MRVRLFGGVAHHRGAPYAGNGFTQRSYLFGFLHRKLIGGQTIEKELEDGGLIISGKVAHPNQILPIVRQWIPHIRIISPEGLQVEMEREIRSYLNTQ